MLFRSEIAVRNMIASARAQFYNISCNLPADKEQARRLLESAQEDWLNAYDEACAKYIDGKIDKERFKKLYFEEIKNCVERNKDKFGIATRFQAMQNVYNEWNNREK